VPVPVPVRALVPVRTLMPVFRSQLVPVRIQVRALVPVFRSQLVPRPTRCARHEVRLELRE